ncbi:NACHT domain-containing protein [Psychromonas sp.]|uniref:NACHT domain-containing protein n=1 Tax=Psychromonas sp. TaxID=1884585 RepID=UPI003A978D45
MWLPRKCGTTRIRMYSLYVAFFVLASSSYPNWATILAKYFESIALNFNQGGVIEILQTHTNLAVSPPLIFALAVIYIVNNSLNDNNSMGLPLSSFDEDIPEPKFQERLSYSIEALREDLKSINNQTNWTRGNYTELDAEIYIKNKGGNKKKLSSLIKALKRKKGRAFLVVGEPGAGKSVALRTLAMELLAQVKNANRIPIYINLKEWNNTYWDVNNPPTEMELYEFVKNNIANRDTELSRFVDNYFDRLYETRRFFFIFDSFDEIPQVMNVDDNSLLIDQLSNVLYKFIKDNNNKPSGIVASRDFRKPTSSFNASSEIEIRPFNSIQIVDSLTKSSSGSKELIESIFTDRKDLYITAKNPFMSSMISKYIEINGKLPSNQLEMFSTFIEDSLDNSKRKLNDVQISKEEVIAAAKDIAFVMYNNYGLEAPVNKLKMLLPQHPIDKVIECLKFSRLLRSNSSDTGIVSYVHRRFCEYFVVLNLRENKTDIPFQDIPRDSQWRDALVLYCEVAEEEDARDIAIRAWNIIKEDQGNGSLEAIHCIRFLRDAFKSRLECISSIQPEIEEFISSQLNEDKIVYWNYFVIQLSCLTGDKNVEKNVLSCLSFSDSWIFETAVESCRHLPLISDELKNKIARYLDKEPDFYFLSNLKKYFFNFSRSDAFKSVRTYLMYRTIDIIMLGMLFFYAFIIYPKQALVLFFIVVLQTSFNIAMGKIGLDNKPDKDIWVYALLDKIFNKKQKNPPKKDSKSYLSHKLKQSEKYWSSFYNNLSLAVFVVKSIILILPVIFVYTYGISLITDNVKIVEELLTLFSEMDRYDMVFVMVLVVSIIASFVRIPLTVGCQHVESDKSNILSFLLILAGVMLVLSVFIIYPKVMTIVVIPIYSVGLFIIVPVFVHQIRCQIKYRKVFNKINVSLLTTRPKIYKAILSLEQNNTYTQKLLDALEVNIAKVSGEWPDDSMLISKNNKFASQLCQMDVRWKKLN